MQVIEGLLRIKCVREESRNAEMRRAKQHLASAAEALRQARLAQQQRDRERAEREQSLYAQVCARTVVVRELDDLKFEVDAMKQHALTDAQAVADAQAQREKRRLALDESTVAWRAAAHAKQKFEDLAAESRAAHVRHMEWLADLELEEFSARGVLAAAMQDDAQEG